jgi:phage terminase Nu1 subunit (DNA packaging protein)
MISRSSFRIIGTLVLSGCASVMVRAGELESREQGIALQAALNQLTEAKANADQQRRSIENLSLELATARRELAQAQAQQSELVKKAALVDQSTGSVATLQHRLIDALSDLGLAREKSQQLEASGLQLKEKLIAAGLPVESAEASTIEKNSFSTIVSYQPELQLAVVKKSSESNFKVGSPVRFQRADRTCARGLVVEVREQIVGILVTELSTPDERPQIGDLTHLEPNNI